MRTILRAAAVTAGISVLAVAVGAVVVALQFAQFVATFLAVFATGASL